MRKVLIIVENNTVPADTRVWKEALALRNAGYGVCVLCPRRGKWRKSHELLDGIDIFRHPLPGEANGPLGYAFEYLAALFWQVLWSWWIFVRVGFQVIHGCNPPDTIFLIALMFRPFGVKYVFDHHDAVPELYLSKYGSKDLLFHAQGLLEKLTFYYSDVVIATNDSYRAIAIIRGNVDPARVFVVRNGPDLTVFRARPVNSRLKHGKSYLVAYVGSLGSQDGLDILVDVALHVKALGRKDIHFTCIGSGPELPKLRRLVTEKGLEHMMTFTGYLPDAEMLEVLSSADVCVNPDRPSQMNNISTMIKIMEYMALGKPIVQFDVKEGRISAGDSSLYADVSNPISDFASKILALVDNPALRVRMGALGRERVERELAWKYSVRHLLLAYECVFATRPTVDDSSKNDGS